MNKKIILSVVVSLMGLVGTTVLAGNASLYATPTTQTIVSGATVNASIFAGATTVDKVCVVTGTLVFNNLTCNSIALTSGMVAQLTPTCANPTFTIGIPKCITTDTKLFAISATAGNVGKGSIDFSGVNLVGLGTTTGTASFKNDYTITAKAVVVAPTENPTPTPEVIVPATTEAIPPQPASLDSAVKSSGLINWIKTHIFWIAILILVIAGAGYWYYSRKNSRSSASSN